MVAEAILDWSGVLTPANGELSELQIEEQYGTLMQSAVSAFRSDPSYVVEIAEASAVLKYKRELVSARAEAVRECNGDKVCVRQTTEQIMRDRGYAEPVRFSKR